MKRELKYAIAVISLFSAIFFALFAGNGAMSTSDVLEVIGGGGSSAQRLILFQIRLPRILAAMFSGAALSVSGFLLQNDLNNVIASPGLLGINSGAGIFVLLSALVFPFQSEMKCVLAFAGALLAAAFVILLSAWTGMSKTSVILSGVAISSLCASVSQAVIALYPETVADKAAFSLGGFANVPLSIVKPAVPVILIVLTVAVFDAGVLDLMMLGDETAAGLGLNVRLHRWLHILMAAVLSGAAVSMCGLVGFIGLMVPNFIRLFYKGKSVGCMVLCVIAGAEFLLLCDTAARLLFFPYELPCGLLLDVLGTPFLIWMLVKKRKKLGSYD